jgi:phosphocarrier protein HPr
MDDYEMKEEKLVIPNRLGMHARSAAEFAKLASTFSSTIEVEKDSMRVNGKSIMELLTVAAAMGTEITVRASGEDEAKAIEALSNLVRDGFGEHL